MCPSTLPPFILIPFLEFTRIFRDPNTLRALAVREQFPTAQAVAHAICWTWIELHRFLDGVTAGLGIVPAYPADPRGQRRYSKEVV